MSTKLIIVLGSGGVGKTTSSASMALALAQQGFKTAVITVDPAKRLAQALGLSSLSTEPQLVFKDSHSAGFADALWLDTQTSFDALVKRLGGNSPNVAKVLSHRLFKIIRDQLGGIEEYLGIDRILRLVNENKYDFCILDTPPSRHALDFLESPKHLLRFFDEGVLKYFMSADEEDNKSGLLGKILKSGKSQAIEVFKNFLGHSFLKELSDLLTYLKPVRDSLKQSAGEIEKLLRSDASRITLVSLLEAYPLAEARLLKIELEGAELPAPHLLILNKCLPKVPQIENSTKDEIIKHLHLQQRLQNELRKKYIESTKIAPVTVELQRFPSNRLDLEQLGKMGSEIIEQWAAYDKKYFLKQ